MLVDIFNQRPFHAVELTAAFEQIDYVPELLGSFGERLFPTRRSRFRTVAVQKKQGRLSLVPVSPIGAPPVQLEKAGGDIRDFRTRRLAKGSTVYAEELQGVLNAPMAEQVKTVQQEVAERGALIRGDIELTHEHMRLGAILGQVRDADGVTVLDDWFANWGIAAPTPINFDLANPASNIRAKCQAVKRAMRDNSKGGFIAGRTEIHAIVGSGFYDMLTTHPNVEKYFLNYQAARDLTGGIGEDFTFGDITWHDYRGTDDGETLAVAEDEARFFPVGGRDVFHRVFGPAEFEPFVNRPGQDIYAMTIPDQKRQAFVEVEAYTYPLYICTRPEMLQVGVAG